MNSPSLGFLGNIVGGLDAFDAGARAQGIAPPAPAAPAPSPPVSPTEYLLAGLPDIGHVGAKPAPPPPAAPTMMDGQGSASTNAAPITVPGVPTAPAPAPAGSPTAMTPAAAPPPSQGYASPDDVARADDVQYRQVGGGGATPAREAYTRGPMQHAATMASFEPEGEAATRSDFRNQLQARAEQDQYDLQARDALQRQEAAEKVALRRAFEMEQQQLDYADQAQKLGQMKLDNNRLWANKSTGDKIGSIVSIIIGSLEALGNGGENLAYKGLLRDIDADVAAQKFDYDVAKDQLQSAQNGYAIMRQRYQDEDAALAAARAGALDFAAAKAGALKASYGGTESANAADMLRAKLEAERDKTLAAGFKFIPSQVSGPRYQVSVRGHVLPGTFDEKKAQEIGLDHAVKPAEKLDETLVQGGLAERLQDRKLSAEQRIAAAKEGKDNTVRLASGEVVTAPSAEEAGKLRSLAAQDMKIRQLVTRAKELRSKGIVTDRGNAAEVASLQQQLRTAFSVSAQLGALSKDDLKIADGAVGDITDPTSFHVDRQLDSYANMVRNDVSNRVKTYATGSDQAPRATGKMPGSFKPAGGK